MSDYSAEKRRSRSLFGPIVLIAIGVYFLLANLGMLQSPNWAAVLPLWPLWLIFIGVNIIVQQAPRPLGGLLSALVAITAVGVFGYVLMFSEDNALLNRLGVTSPNVAVTTEPITYQADDISSATVEIDFTSAGGEVYALEDSSALIDGTVSYSGDLVFDTSRDGSSASVFLDTRSSDVWWFWFNPANWDDAGRLESWQIGLNPNVETELRLDTGSGALDLALDELTLSYLELDGGSGAISVTLPDGDYGFNVDIGSGASRYVLPANGRLDMEVDGGSGSMVFELPEGMEARIELDQGSGSFNHDGRLRLVEGDRDGDGVWESDGYDDDAANRVDLFIDTGSGSVTVTAP